MTRVLGDDWLLPMLDESNRAWFADATRAVSVDTRRRRRRIEENSDEPEVHSSGGYFRFEDDDSGSGFVKVPANFFGDWTSLDRAADLSSYHKIFQGLLADVAELRIRMMHT